MSQRLLKEKFHQAVQKRSWFDRLTMTTLVTLSSSKGELAEGKDEGSMQTPSPPFE